MHCISKAAFAVFAVAFSLWSGPACAFPADPWEPGFSGYVLLGGGFNRAETNMIAGSDEFEVGRETIDSLADPPGGRYNGVPQINFDLKYTFAKTRTQLFAGTRMEDLLRFDFTTQAGVRQGLGMLGAGAIGVAAGFIPTEVWKDPYVTGQKREKTERTSLGVRAAWEGIFGSALVLDYTYRKVHLDRELSGDFLGLSPDRRQLLDREGDVHQIRAIYGFRFGDHSLFAPTLSLILYDLDGKAMAGATVDLQPTYMYTGEKVDWVLNAFLGHASYKETNPVFGKTREDMRYGAAATLFWKRPFGWKPFGLEKLRVYVQASFFASNSNIDFYETRLLNTGAGFMVGF